MKVPLTEVAEAVKREAWSWENTVSIHEREHGPLPPDHHWVRRKMALNVAAKTLAVMATYEDRSRDFIAQLLKDYAG